MRIPAPARMFVLALAVHVTGSWSLPLIDRDEPRFAEASREMMQRGDWMVPWLNNVERFDKPPLIYWTQIGCYRLFGENDVAARLPSAVFAGGVAALLVVFGRRFASGGGVPAGKAGWWAGLIFTLCAQTIMHAKAAVADMAMVFFVTAAVWAAWECGERLRSSGRDRPGWFAWGLLCHVALGLGFLAKGPIAWLPLALLFWFAACARAKPWQIAALAGGFVVCLAIVAAWGVPALAVTEGRFFKIGIGKHVVERGLVAQEGHGSSNLWQYLLHLPYFFALVFVSFFPWSLKLSQMVNAARRKGFGEPGERALWGYVAVVFVVFTLYKTKLPHYTLPAFPVLALLFAHHWFLGGRGEEFLKRSAVGMVAFVAVFAAVGGPLLGDKFVCRRIEEVIRRHAENDTTLGSVSYKEPSLVWALRGRSRGWHEPLNAKEAARFASRPGPRILVVPKGGEVGAAAAWERIEVGGINPARGRWEVLDVFVRPGAEP